MGLSLCYCCRVKKDPFSLNLETIGSRSRWAVNIRCDQAMCPSLSFGLIKAQCPLSVRLILSSSRLYCHANIPWVTLNNFNPLLSFFHSKKLWVDCVSVPLLNNWWVQVQWIGSQGRNRGDREECAIWLLLSRLGTEWHEPRGHTPQCETIGKAADLMFSLPYTVKTCFFKFQI